MTIKEVIKDAMNNSTDEATSFLLLSNITAMLSGFAMEISSSKLEKWREKMESGDEIALNLDMCVIVSQLLDADESLLGKEDKEDPSIIYVGNYLGKVAAFNLNNRLGDMAHIKVKGDECADKEKLGCQATFCDDIKLCPKSPYYDDICDKGKYRAKRCEDD